MHEASPQTVGIRLENLKPEVRSYVQKLRASLQVVYDKYEVTNRDELAAKVRTGMVKQEDIDQAIELMTVINDCGKKNEIVGSEPQKPDEVRLKDIPTFSKLPSESELKKKFKLNWIWKDEYHEGRDANDFSLTDKDLRSIGFDDLRKRQELLQEIASGRENKEAEPLARVFDINETIAKKKQEDSNHPDWLTTKEVFEAIDEAGYRPATLEELLAFDKQFWKPDTVNESLTEVEKSLQHVNAPYIYALSSPFTNSGGIRYVPCLYWNGDECSLNGRGLGRKWDGDYRFLAVRKVSS